MLYALWGMQLTQGTDKLSPEASGCGVRRNCRIANPLQSHHHLEWPPGDAASPDCQDDSWGTSLHNRAGPPQHPTACVVNSSVTAILVRSQRTRTIMHTPQSVHPPLGTFRRPPELVYRTEPAAAACNCMGSQQLCHSCSRSLLVNDNDHAHSLECASTAEDLQEVPRIHQTLQVPHPVLIHKPQQGQGATDRPICFCCFLRVTMTMHAPRDMHPPLGTLKQSPKLLRHCISCA